MIDREPKSRGWRDFVGLAARVILGATLLVSSLTKLGNLAQFLTAVQTYRLFDWVGRDVAYPLELTITYVVPVIELLVGLLLLVGLFTRVAGAIGAGLMLVFIAGIASVWARGISLDCGCFGGGGLVEPDMTRYPEEILRDIGFMACGLWLAVRPKTPLALDSWLFRPTSANPADDGGFDDDGPLESDEEEQS